MDGPFREPRPGEVFWLDGLKTHFVGTLEDDGDTLYVFWDWNKWKQRRHYWVNRAMVFRITWEYLQKHK